MKKSMFRMAMLLVLILSTFAGSLCCAYADGNDTTTTTDDEKKDDEENPIDYLEKDKDKNNLLNDQTDKFKTIFGSIYKFLMVAVNSLGVIALLVCILGSLFNVGEPQTKQKLKSAGWTIFIIIIVANVAVNLVFWGITLARGMF